MIGVWAIEYSVGEQSVDMITKLPEGHHCRELDTRLCPCFSSPIPFSADAGTPIMPAMHGDSSGVRGAAWLWPISGIYTTLSG